MNIKYCSLCGAKTEYTIKQPKFCGGCGKDFLSAFIKIEVDKSKIVTEDIENNIEMPIVKKTSKYLNVSNIQRKNRNPKQIDREEEEEDSIYDPNEVENLAKELAASIKNDIVTKSSHGPNNVFKLGDIFKNPDQFNSLGERIQHIEPNIESE